MTGAAFINAMGKIDEKYVIEALNYQRPARRRPQVWLTIRRSVIAASLAVVVVFSGLMTVEAYREKVIEVIVQVFHDLTAFRYVSTVEERTMPDVEFGYVPEGLEMIENDVDTVRRFVLFETPEGEFVDLMVLVVRAGDSVGSILDTENAITEYIEINGNEVLVNDKNGMITINWTEYNAVFNLTGNIEKSEMLEIARNLKVTFE